ncbi:hypothetical protein M5K25_009183 [Dendrobium thyrsiflorum]|uniref:Uncharacterized protein n=1 Tax=Dendrobium thyrsiflorum TaxID=117978 RepID=A0ABD0V5N2_DENTH
MVADSIRILLMERNISFTAFFFLSLANGDQDSSSAQSTASLSTFMAEYSIPSPFKFLISNIKFTVNTQLINDNYTIWCQINMIYIKSGPVPIVVPPVIRTPMPYASLAPARHIRAPALSILQLVNLPQVFVHQPATSYHPPVQFGVCCSLLVHSYVIYSEILDLATTTPIRVNNQ